MFLFLSFATETVTDFQKIQESTSKMDVFRHKAGPNGLAAWSSLPDHALPVSLPRHQNRSDRIDFLRSPSLE